MKHGIVIVKSFDDIHYGQTLDIIKELEYGYRAKIHGDDKDYTFPKYHVQVAEDIYDYSTNPRIVNK